MILFIYLLLLLLFFGYYITSFYMGTVRELTSSTLVVKLSRGDKDLHSGTTYGITPTSSMMMWRLIVC